MNLCSNRRPIERAQPWLGTLVSIRVEGLGRAEAHQAIDAAFQGIATVHRLMSFHDPASDVSQVNREAANRPVEVHSWTYSVLECAQQCSRISEGCFDISVGAELVKWRMLPAPVEGHEPRGGSWRDIELLPGSRVAFRRPLWIDLGGIAKGFAVDRATDCLAEFGPSRTVVNAGGDIRVHGSEAEPIRLGAPCSEGGMPVLELADGSAAGSRAVPTRCRHRGYPSGSHLDGALHLPAPRNRFACVVSERCMTADALTKVVLAQGEKSDNVLRQYGASAWIKDPNKDWRRIGAEIG